ncbi:MAG: bifunctional pyr operon transcriptional regulator/uracil phosphoribosyltransferase [Desulfobulbaceae bacterium A2]|nr:MAG: bifunctional pyr operon transcriptional regulator/uracil phosphoribosyltransferase [Desulfobulbaceae bacterium A2]
MNSEREVLMNEQDIDRSLDRLAMEVVERNHGTEGLVLIGIHTGGVFLARRIQQKILALNKCELPLGSLDITLYRDDWSMVAQHPIVKRTDIGFLVDHRRVVLIDDVLYTGRTIRAALDALMDFGRPESIRLLVLVDRGGRELPIQPDYVGLEREVGGNERIDVLLREHDGEDQVIVGMR